MTCLACGSESLHLVHIPAGTRRVARVFDCHYCGLLQTSLEIESEKTKTLSSDADWGNVRHAKPLRLNANRGRLNELLGSLPDAPRVLDIGASRGHFLQLLNESRHDSLYEGVESDLTLPRFKVKQGLVHYAKFEECKQYLNLNPYDLVFLNHTLEHVDDPKSLLESCRALMKTEAILWIDVPNTEQIKDPFIVEEYFIDKHTVHFTRDSLKYLLGKVGFKIVSDFSDNLNLVLLCKANDSINLETNPQYSCIQKVVNEYRYNLDVNRQKLTQAVHRLNLLNDGLLIFGAGRLLDSLVRFGGLESHNFTICDSYLHKYADGLQYKISSPEEVDWDKVRTVAILARSSKCEIEVLVREKCGAKIINFGDLLQS